MIGFIIKKAFFDTWDNLFKLVILNFITVPFLFLLMLGFKIISTGNLLGLTFIVLGVVLVVVHLGTLAYFVNDIGNSQSVTLVDYLKYLKKDLKIKLQFAFAWIIFIVVTLFSITYYFNGKGIISLIPLALVFWFSTLTSISVLLFFSIKVRLKGNFKKVLKKCFILLLDNPLTGILMFIYAIILVILSLPTLALLPPGYSGLMVLVDTTVHMYELKYDYLEKNPDADRKKLPWQELIHELNENIGPRSLRGMIFPWKY